MSGDTTVTKVCKKCGREKPLDEFPKHPETRDGHLGSCRECQRDATRANKQKYEQRHPGRVTAWQQANPANARAKRTRYERRHISARSRAAVLKRFGLTEAQYEQMLARQHGGCAICGKTNGQRRLCIDHDHQTGRVRGLLCDWCNRALGMFLDHPKLLMRAFEYVSQARADDWEAS